MVAGTHPRTLFCITVYNGRDFVPATLASAERLMKASPGLDVLVLDDCSPDPGWSDELRDLCHASGLGYYRSPRNLGIPRNVNLGLRTAVARDYDFVVISNSDVLYPSNLIEELTLAASVEGVGSVTAWSNNVSVYSLPVADPDALRDQDVVDWLSASLAGNFSGAVMDIPAGISFCIMIPVPVVKDVGLMDPVYGRGYCEETDWTLRSKALGYRIGLAPAAFVYHEGGGTNRAAGLVAEGQTSVPGNEAIIDLRYPQFRDQVEAFMSSDVLTTAHADAARRIVLDAGAQFGYSIDVGWLPLRGSTDLVRCVIAPEGEAVLRASFLGFSFEETLDGVQDVGAHIRERFGREPTAVNVFDRGGRAREIVAQGFASDHFIYPTKV